MWIVKENTQIQMRWQRYSKICQYNYSLGRTASPGNELGREMKLAETVKMSKIDSQFSRERFPRFPFYMRLCRCNLRLFTLDSVLSICFMICLILCPNRSPMKRSGLFENCQFRMLQLCLNLACHWFDQLS